MIWFPKSVEVLTSDDGKNFISLYKKELEVPSVTGPGSFGVQFSQVKTKYLKVIATPRQVIPKGFNGAGSKLWILVDEMEIL